MNSAADHEYEQQSPVVISITFWLMLLIAAGLYAAVALAPKLEAHLLLRQSYVQNQIQLVALEKQVSDLERVALALEYEPEFAEELARVEFDAGLPGDQRVPVKRGLWLDRPGSVPAGTPSAYSLPWYMPVVRAFAHDRSLRKSSLIAAAIVLLLAFTFLHESQEPKLRSACAGFGKAARSTIGRYQAPYES